MTIDLLVEAIHYFNYLFHLAEHTEDHLVKVHFRQKKNELQLELLERFPDEVVLQDDETEGMVLITIRNFKKNACHFPKDLLPMD